MDIAKSIVIFVLLTFAGIKVISSDVQNLPNFSNDECKQDPIVKIVKQEFGFTFGAFLVKKPIITDSNFAGYYQIEEEGCGTECYTFNMKDLRTGEMIDSPKNCPGGFAYFSCSNLLICNSETIAEESYQQYSWYTPTAYFWDEEKRAFIEIIQPKSPNYP